MRQFVLVSALLISAKLNAAALSESETQTIPVVVTDEGITVAPTEAFANNAEEPAAVIGEDTSTVDGQPIYLVQRYNGQMLNLVSNRTFATMRQTLGEKLEFPTMCRRSCGWDVGGGAWSGAGIGGVAGGTIGAMVGGMTGNPAAAAAGAGIGAIGGVVVGGTIGGVQGYQACVDKKDEKCQPQPK